MNSVGLFYNIVPPPLPTSRTVAPSFICFAAVSESAKWRHMTPRSSRIAERFITLFCSSIMLQSEKNLSRFSPTKKSPTPFFSKTFSLISKNSCFSNLVSSPFFIRFLPRGFFFSYRDILTARKYPRDLLRKFSTRRRWMRDGILRAFARLLSKVRGHSRILYRPV